MHRITNTRTDSILLLGIFPLHMTPRYTRAMIGTLLHTSAMIRTLLHVSLGRRNTNKRGLFCGAPSVFEAFIAACTHAYTFGCTMCSAGLRHARILGSSLKRQFRCLSMCWIFGLRIFVKRSSLIYFTMHVLRICIFICSGVVCYATS